MDNQKQDLFGALKGLPMKSIRNILEDLSISMTWVSLHCRDKMMQCIMDNHKESIQDIIARALECKENIQLSRSVRRKEIKDNRREDYRRRLRELRSEKLNGCNNIGTFPDIVSEKDQLHRLRQFREHTDDLYIQQVVCSSCAGRFDQIETTELPLDNIPNKTKLYPIKQHPAHTLYEGMLLHSETVTSLEEGSDRLRLCRDCLSSLQEDSTPKFSLANNLWVGEVPLQLSILTIPERLLISVYYPCAFIVKLYPKAPNAKHWKSNDVNFGLRGNVSTYKLDTSGIYDMVKGNLMPRPPEILASLFSITLIGPQGKPDNAIRSLCQVRRSRVLDALLWLKSNNPFYSSIDIDYDILSRLPPGDIPESISHNVKHAVSISDPAEKSGRLRPGTDSDTDSDENVEGVFVPPSHDARGSDDDEISTGFDEPTVLVLDESGVVEVDGFDINSSDLLVEALKNTLNKGNEVEPPYAILRGRNFVNEYPRRDESGNLTDVSDLGVNHLLGAFPYLFPYGVGGFETDRPLPVSYIEHARWSLRYYDGRFAKNITFLSLIFNVIQKRQVCLGAELQMKRKDYHTFERSINSITPAILRDAVKEERGGNQPSNPAVRTLKSFVKATRKHVPGTDENRIANRSKIYGMTLLMNPANVWMTITVDDINDPIVQIYSGSKITLDRFCPSLGPDSKERLWNSTQNPYATTKFFYRIIKLILEDLLGITVSPSGRIHRERGILGRVAGYTGMVEAQSRGTLHLHLLLWLEGSLSSTEMLKSLSDPVYRQNLEIFIQQNVKSHVDGLDDEYFEKETTLQKKLHKERASAYSRPIDPSADDFEDISRPLEFSLVRTLQVHRCSNVSCLIHDKYGRLRCKRRAPWTLSLKDIVYESGLWYSKRSYGFLNSWNPIILFATRSNNDIKILTNGADSRHITFYTTNYATKAQFKSYQATALLADKFAYIKRGSQDDSGIRQKNKKLLSQCAHTLTRCQELSNQQMVSYIMGFGDSLLSHRFVPIYLSGALHCLERTFPEFRNREFVCDNPKDSQTEVDNAVESESLSYHLQMTDDGLRVRNQLSDYTFRGTDLEDFSFLNFLLETYEPRHFDYNTDTSRHERIPYSDDSTVHQNRHRILRHPHCEMMPDFLGSWVPRNDRKETFEFYCATVLLLLKPWRKLTDLRYGFITWTHAFDDFISHATDRERRIIDNFQFYYETSDAAKKVATDEIKHRRFLNEDTSFDLDQPPLSPEINFPGHSLNRKHITFDELAANCENSAEASHGQDALRIADDAGVFDEDSTDWSTNSQGISHASMQLINQNFSWQQSLKNYIKSIDGVDRENALIVPSTVIQLNDLSGITSHVQPFIHQSLSTETIDEIFRVLTEGQSRACKIIYHHLDQYLAGTPQNPLRMLICGSGGVGKSTVIRSVQKLFELRSVSDKLATTATSGVAASNIDGNTVHWWAGLSIKIPQTSNFTEKSSESIKQRRHNNIANCRYLILDEVSMLSQETLGLLATVVSGFSGDDNPDDPFGGKLSIILIGDFHQFPPTAHPDLALFKPPGNSLWSRIGHRCFQLFKTVVLLTEQKRVVDPTWGSILERLRIGRCTPDDISEINKLSFSPMNCVPPDFSSEPWNNSILVTPRHAVRRRWNLAAIKKFSRLNSKVILVADARHTFGNGTPIDPISNKDVLTAIAIDDKRLGKVLPRKVHLAVGLRILLTFNIRVSADLANGTSGVITNIFLDPREPAIPSGVVFHKLIYLPKLIYFKPDRSSFPPLPNLPRGILPIEPSSSKFSVSLTTGGKISIQRTQYPLEPAYSFTDYKAQGSTIAPVILDLRSPPTSKLNQFNLYVAMSRGVSRDLTRLLTSLDRKLFDTPPDYDLVLFDDELAKRDNDTRKIYSFLNS